jgi:hypothetical protein
LNIQWKQQHINNACVPACVAILLSQHNIQKEDSEIIYESKRPYLIEFNKSQNSFNAGVLIQSSEIINIVPNKYNLEMVHNEFDNFSNYFEKAKNLLKDNTTFLTSLAQGYIPSAGYKQNKSKNGHAVVVYKIENDRFYFLDPDGGVDRKEKNKFEKVKDLVSYNIHKSEIQKILEIRNKFIIGHLKKQSKIESNVLNLLTESKQIFEKLSKIFREQANLVINENGKSNYNQFYRFILQIIKPIALDLKNALLTIPNPSNQEQKLISKLDELFKNTLKIQKLLKENPDLTIRNHFNSLSEIIDKIQIVAVKVVTDEIQKCH